MLGVPAVCIGVYRAKYSQAFLRKSGVTVPCTPIHPHNNGTHSVPGIYSTATVTVPLQNSLEMAHRGLKKIAFEHGSKLRVVSKIARNDCYCTIVPKIVQMDGLEICGLEVSHFFPIDDTDRSG
jgi:hypothetical protein